MSRVIKVATRARHDAWSDSDSEDGVLSPRVVLDAIFEGAKAPVAGQTEVL